MREYFSPENGSSLLAYILKITCTWFRYSIFGLQDVKHSVSSDTFVAVYLYFSWVFFFFYFLLLLLKVTVVASAVFTKGQQVHSETKNNVIPSRWYNSMTAVYMRENHPTGMRSQPPSGGLLISDSIFERNVVIWESTKFGQRRIY